MSEFSIEVIRPWKPEDFAIRFCLFDFDGTVSLIRQGWQDIMIPYFCEELRKTGCTESDENIYGLVREFVTDLTGKQTIFQCIALAEEVRRRGSTPKDPGEYKAEYLNRLERRIRDRKEGLAAGRYQPEEWMVRGTRDFLEGLRGRGVRCCLASGTDEESVREEAKLLRVDDLFDGGIWGARDELFRGRRKEEIRDIKAEVIRGMLSEERIDPSQLAGFGDGFMEIELVSGAGGLAIGAATDERRRSGIDRWKRERLIRAGARAIIPDFSDPEALLNLTGLGPAGSK